MCGFVGGSVADLSDTASVNGGQGAYKITEASAFVRRQFMALFIKRFHFIRRNKKGWIAEVRFTFQRLLLSFSRPVWLWHVQLLYWRLGACALTHFRFRKQIFI